MLQQLQNFLGVHVGGWIDTLLRELGDLDVESRLDLLQNFLVLLGRDKGDGQTLGTESTSSTDSVQVLVGLSRQVVVDGQVDTLDIDTSTEDIGGDTDTLVELLKGLVSGDSLLLLQTGVDSNGWEVTSTQQLVQLNSSLGRSDEDDDLVELQGVQQVSQLLVLLGLLQFEVVLLQTVQGQLGLIVDVNLQWGLHELLTNRTDLLGQSGREHHHLLLVRGVSEDVLDISSHVQGLQDLVTLIDDEGLDVVQTNALLLHESVQSTGSSDYNVRTGLFVLQLLQVSSDWSTTVEDIGLDVRHVLGETSVLVTDLVSQFSGVTDDQGGDLTGNRLQLLQSGQDKDGGFTQTGLGLTQDIGTQDRLGDTDLLNWNVSE